MVYDVGPPDANADADADACAAYGMSPVPPLWLGTIGTDTPIKSNRLINSTPNPTISDTPACPPTSYSPPPSGPPC
jgi:hypothetical protein